MAKFIFYIPIYNLKLKGIRSISINSKIKLITFTKYQRNKIHSFLKKLINNNPHYRDNEEMKKEILKFYSKDLDKYNSKTCVRIEINDKDAKNALSRSIEITNQIINIIKLYRYPNDDSYKRYFGIDGEVIERGNRTFYSIEGVNKVTTHGERIGPLFEFEIDKTRFDYMQKNKFKEILSIFNSKNKSDLDKKILSAINWFGESFNSNSPTQEKSKTLTLTQTLTPNSNSLNNIHNTKRFLNCVIALESLFVGKNETSIKENLSKRFTFLMNNNYEDRLEGYKIIKKYMN